MNFSVFDIAIRRMSHEGAETKHILGYITANSY